MVSASDWDLACLCVFRSLRLPSHCHLSAVNDAFTDQDCFQRIDRRLRATLKRKQVPLVSVLHGRAETRIYMGVCILFLCKLKSQSVEKEETSWQLNDVTEKSATFTLLPL